MTWCYCCVGYVAYFSPVVSLQKFFIKNPPPVGAGRGSMFSGRPSVRASVRASVIHVVVFLCFRDISSICWRIFAKLLSLVHLRTEMNWLDFGVKRSKFKVTAWPSASQIFMCPLYLQYLLIDFCQTLSLVHLGTQMTWLRFWVERSKVKVTPSRRRRTALGATIECNFF